MKKKIVLKAVSVSVGLMFAVGLACGTLAACGGGEKSLVLSMDMPDGVFNPFFYTSGTDGEVVGQTMIGMISTDKNGQIVAGKDEPCVALNYSVFTTGTSEDRGTPGSADEYKNYYTDYYFAVKDDIKFSDGTNLTINDVLFNIYMYLDPAYTGSATMYSVDIQGLKAYRTQTTDANQQEQLEGELSDYVETRVSTILDWAAIPTTTMDDLRNSSENGAAIDDLDKIDGFFKEEIQTDWNNAMSADLKEYEKYVDKDGKKLITEAWQVFLYNYGIIKLNPEKDPADASKKWYTIENNFNTAGETTEAALTNYVFETKLNRTNLDTYKDNITEILTYYATANSFRQYLHGVAIKAVLGSELNVRTINGITTEKRADLPTDSTGTTKAINEEEPEKMYDVLHIRINGEDPKAIQNFGFTVAPLHYYSSHASEFNLTEGKEYFGVEFGDSTFMDSVRYIQVPLGAGPYRVSTENGSAPTDLQELKDSKNAFYSNNVVYFESNEKFFLGAPKIKRLRYKVVNTAQLYEAVKSGEIGYASPSGTREMIANLEGADKNVLDYTLTENLGYGYIGINATYVNDINIRKAIMYAMNTQLCIDYYGDNTLATAIYRPMSTVLKDYYPTNCTAYYPYDESGQTSLRFADAAGYELDMNSGYLVNSKGERLKFTFTIAGDSTDHPAYGCMLKAAEILNNIGFDVTVTRDSTALSKLAAGRLEVWAAAWSSSSDPDMYQVYHKDSSATSILAWGFPWIETDGTTYERGLLEELAVRIEEGRETTDVAARKEKYSISTGSKLDEDGAKERLCALDLVMELAVELPTYQRKALYVYQRDLFDDESIAKYFGSQNATAFQSPLSRIWEIGFKE